MLIFWRLDEAFFHGSVGSRLVSLLTSETRGDFEVLEPTTSSPALGRQGNSNGTMHNQKPHGTCTMNRDECWALGEMELIILHNESLQECSVQSQLYDERGHAQGITAFQQG